MFIRAIAGVALKDVAIERTSSQLILPSIQRCDAKRGECKNRMQNEQITYGRM
jgi:hypothetical protein